MNPKPRHSRRSLVRWAAAALTASVLAACGGGGDDAGPTMEGSRQSATIRSSGTGTTYPLNIYLPPASAGPRSDLPVMYVLDGESWFDTLVAIAESTRQRVIIVGVGTSGQRARDFVPVNSCTPTGGGHVAYFDFIRQELIPYVESTVGGHPARRALFGHSHGGSFVLYAMFSQAPGQHSFKTYLASDSSISCMPTTASGWESDYAAAYSTLPVRLHLSYASQGNYNPNVDYAAAIAQNNFANLVMVAKAYSGTHSGIVPQVLADVMGFAFLGSP